MIHLFQGCGMICKAPCYCCKAVGVALDGVCTGCSEACNSCTKAISDCWAPIVQNPLGWYVIVTWFVMLLVVGCCAATIPDAANGNCNELMIFCFAEIIIALIHAVFAFYIQTRLVAALAKSQKDTMSHQEITAEAKNLAKFDIGFCLYFFVFLAATGYNFYSIGWDGDCSGTYYQKGAVGLLVCYGVCAWNYAFCWYCGQCCFGKAEKRNIIRTHGGGGTPSPETVGAAAPLA
mmetsp:Transcript_14928/g.42917  ORF Transcript_14928/g.42917 Transcript_14928/m.42917 type:complete len:234 (+) Transcript_14928:58-759(+)